MRLKKIAIRYGVLLWFAVVFTNYYMAFLDKLFFAGKGQLNATFLLNLAKELIGKIL